MNSYPQSDFFDFETLELYKKSLDYVDFVYDLITLFPDDERPPGHRAAARFP